MDLDAIKSFRLTPVEHRYTVRDTILYALGLGYGDQPLNPKQLQFVYEKGLVSVPSMCVTLAHPGMWVREPALKIDWIKLLHGEQSFEIFRPLPPQGCVTGEFEIVAVEDKGEGKGATLHIVKRLFDSVTRAQLALVTSAYVLRGDGGQGGFGLPPPPPAPLPDGAPDRVIDIRTLPQSALIYRLSGDLNPIHADPDAAARAGFAQPILHGLCSLGIATRALIDAVCDADPAKMRLVSLRFSKPVIPGETVRIEIFQTGAGIRFRARAVERDVIVLDRGSAGLAR